jgi:hypothetical protein
MAAYQGFLKRCWRDAEINSATFPKMSLRGLKSGASEGEMTFAGVILSLSKDVRKGPPAMLRQAQHDPYN